MQPKPLKGFILAKEKKAKDLINAGFELPENYGSSERAAGLCEVIDIGDLNRDDFVAFTNYYAQFDSVPGERVFDVEDTHYIHIGDIVVFAPFSDFKLTLGSDEWLLIEYKNLMANLGPVKGDK